MTGPPLAALRRLTGARRTVSAPPADSASAEERCDLCAVSLGPEHPHLVDVRSRRLLCGCRPCALLFSDERADLRYRTIPDRYLSLGDPLDEVELPVGLAFVFRNSAQDRMVACYPGPAGATESELPLPAWTRLVERHPALATLRPDVEALLIRPADCHLVPIDACYELAGTLRTLWQGFDGGPAAHAAIDAFFARVRQRSHS
ncbi:MAG: DUF5947 family protein [Actinoplanes sp.]